MQTMDDSVVAVEDPLGPGITYAQLSMESPIAASDFPRAAEAITERFEFDGETGVTAAPYQDWTFHYLGGGRWVARVAPYRDSQPLFMEWITHSSRWDDVRVRSSVEFAWREETQPLRGKPRAIDSTESG